MTNAGHTNTICHRYRCRYSIYTEPAQTPSELPDRGGGTGVKGPHHGVSERPQRLMSVHVKDELYRKWHR